MVQRHNAKTRGIGWELSFKEWLFIWYASGHLRKRGKRRGEYCMARLGDKGPYKVGNVRIVPTRVNQNEAHIGRIKTAEERRKLSLAMTGKKASLKTRMILSKAHLGIRLSDETRMKISIAQKARRQRERIAKARTAK